MNRIFTLASVSFGATAVAAVLVPRPTFAHEHGDWQPSPEMRAEFAAAEAAAFTQADTDGNGKLSADEFANFHDIMRRQMDAHHFQMLDADGDGALSLDEIKAGHGGGPPCGGGD